MLISEQNKRRLLFIIELKLKKMIKLMVLNDKNGAANLSDFKAGEFGGAKMYDKDRRTRTRLCQSRRC